MRQMAQRLAVEVGISRSIPLRSGIRWIPEKLKCINAHYVLGAILLSIYFVFEKWSTTVGLKGSVNITCRRQWTHWQRFKWNAMFYPQTRSAVWSRGDMAGWSRGWVHQKRRALVRHGQRNRVRVRLAYFLLSWSELRPNCALVRFFRSVWLVRGFRDRYGGTSMARTKFLQTNNFQTLLQSNCTVVSFLFHKLLVLTHQNYGTVSVSLHLSNGGSLEWCQPSTTFLGF